MVNPATADTPNCQKYGVPLYGAAWLPRWANQSHQNASGDGDGAGDDGSARTASAIGGAIAPNYLVFAGGGGEGRSGIPNAVLLAQFDFASNSLSDEPVSKLQTDGDLPYRMAVHPRGEGLICSLPKSCRWFEWDITDGSECPKLGLKSSDKVLTQLENVGQQLTLRFNEDGSLIAVGGEDGHLRVFKWPSMEIIINEDQAHAAVKDLDFSLDGKYLVSVGSGGPGRVWDVTSTNVVASLPKENDEVFGSCRFSQGSDGNQVLYTTMMHGKGGSIVLWSTSSWKRIKSKQIVRDPVSAFNVSSDGKLLAIGTIQGDILVINSTNMRVLMMVKKAHLGLVTALMFSHDSRALVSASMDASARVTMVQEEKRKGFKLWVILLIMLLAVAVYLLKVRGIIV